jgi:hypothetical protein
VRVSLINRAFLAFPPVAATPSRFGNVSTILLLFVNGSETLAVARRDKDATRTSVRGGSRIWLSEAKALLAEGYGGASRLAEKLLTDELAAGRMPWGSLLQKGEASDDFWKSGPRVNFEENSATNWPVARILGFVGFDGSSQWMPPPRSCEHFGVWLSRPHVLALLPEPTGAEVPAPLASAQWAIAATRRLLDEGKIREGITKAKLSRLLEAEAQKAVRAGQIDRALKAPYLENQLTPWGIWPLSSLE